MSDPKVKALFEELRRDEAEHIRLVRQRLENLPPGPDLENDDADEPGSDGADGG